MTIYFASSEDIDFTLVTGIWSQLTTAGFYDGLYARSAIRLNGSGTPRNAFRCDMNGASLTNMWISMRARHDDPASTLMDDDMLNLRQGTQVVARIDAANGVWSIQTWDGGWTIRDTFSIQLTAGVIQKMIIKFTLHASNGEFSIWINDNLTATWLGDTIGDTGATAIDNLLFQEAGASSSLDQFYSEIMVADEDITNMRCATLWPNADGNATAWSGGWADVDENTVSEADFITSDTADQVEMMNVTPYLGSTELFVHSVFVSAKTARNAISAIQLEDGAGNLQLEDGTGDLLLEDVSGPESAQLGIRHNVTDSFSVTKPLTSASETINAQFTLNPDTSQPFTVAELDTVQAGIKSIA